LTIAKYWQNRRLKALLFPGGAVLLVIVLVIETGLLPSSSAGADFYYYAAMASGGLLAWRFRNARILFTLLTIALSHRAVAFFSPNHFTLAGPGRIAFLAAAVLVPINFMVFAAGRERGLSLPALAPRAGLLLFEAIVVALICRPGATVPLLLKMSFGLPLHASRLPQLGILIFAASVLFIVLKNLSLNRPSHAAQVWALVASWIAFEKGYLGRWAEIYLATAGLILVVGIVEDSYRLAYDDELTGIPGRRAFNDAVAQLEAPYVIAAIDIDHFKTFNDTYGHDTGDQVLRLVANRLARVAGEGKAFRVGGEEFAIVFAGKRMNETISHLESLRLRVEQSSFRQRTGLERRGLPRGPDRRRPRKQSVRKKQLDLFRDDCLSVTVSIGVAEAFRPAHSAAGVIESADKALYRAKKAGRNRVETSGKTAPRKSRAKEATA
jgi:GGDEF domain-containing protein